MVRVKSMPSKLSFSCSPLSGSSYGKTPPLALVFSSMRPLTSVSASLLSKDCIACSVDSTLLAALKSRAFCRFVCGSSRKDFFAAALLKQYSLPSLSVQVMVQLVATCWPCASPSAHWPPNCGAGVCAGEAAGGAAARASGSASSSATIGSAAAHQATVLLQRLRVACFMADP